MIIGTLQIRGYLQPGESRDVRNAEGELCFVAEYQRILELVDNGHVCGRGTKSKLRFLELIVPLAEASKPHKERAGAGCVAQDSRTVHGGNDLLALAYAHDFRVIAAFGPGLRHLTQGETRKTLPDVPIDVLQGAYEQCGDGIS